MVVSRKYSFMFVCFFAQTTLSAQMGLIGGGTETDLPIAYVVNSETAIATPISGLPDNVPGLFGPIESVSLSNQGSGILAGGYVNYLVDTSTYIAKPINGLSSTFFSYSVAISDNGLHGIIGGTDILNNYAYNIDVVSNTATMIQGISPQAIPIFSVAINGEGTIGLISAGDSFTNGAFAYLYDFTSNTTTQIPLLSAEKATPLNSDLDLQGNFGLIGLRQSGTGPAAYIVNTTELVANPIVLSEQLQSAFVSINDAGSIGLIAGFDSSSNSSLKIYKVEIPTGIVTEIPLFVQNIASASCALNSSGTTGIIAFNDQTNQFVTVLDLKTNALTIVNGIASTSLINSIAIQDSGKAGLLGGSDQATNVPLVYLLPDIIHSPALSIRILLPGVFGSINSVDFAGLLNQIPTGGLSGNNLRLANYLNANASDTVSFFIPSVLNGTLNQALESAAPTRNSAPLFALNNNFFSIRQGLTQRAINSRLINRNLMSSEEISFLASRQDDCCYVNPCLPNTLWAQVMGLDADQDRQNQTPSFHPWSVGFVVGYDNALTQDFTVGAAASYMYSHLNMNHNQGNSTVNQEYIGLYGLWEKNAFYANASLWFGLFQIDRVRKIHLDEFLFRATSDSFGFQFDPHLELGYDYRFCDSRYTVEPFVLFDWIQNWQSSYKESGNGPFLFKQNRLHASVFRTETGFRFYQKIPFCSWNLILQESGSYIYRKPYSLGDVTGALIGAPGTLTLLTLTDAQNLGSAGLVFVFEPVCLNYPVGTIAYKGEFGSGYQSHQVSLGIEWSF